MRALGHVRKVQLETTNHKFLNPYRETKYEIFLSGECRSRPFDQIPRLREEDFLTRVLACSYVSVWLPRCNHVTPSISLYTPTNKLVFEPLVNGNIYRRIDAYRLSIHNRLFSYNNRLPYEHIQRLMPIEKCLRK